MPWCTLFLKLCEDPRVIGVHPFPCHKIHYPVAIAFTFPDGDYFFPVYLSDFIIYLKETFVLNSVYQDPAVNEG